MFNKNLCKKCITENDSKWDSLDEKAWKEGKVFCYYIDECININDNIVPDKCPYKAEQENHIKK